MKIIFAGTPEFACPSLQALIDKQHEILMVYTQPDRPAGRGRKLSASPVKQLAMQHHLPICQVASLKSMEAQQQLAQLNADVMVVAAYGLILPKAVLAAPKYGCINVHASLLPRWRGAAPIQRAMEAGDTQTGITIMQMAAGLDTGDMLLKVPTTIDEQDTAQTLQDRLATLGAQALMTVLNDLSDYQSQAQTQDDQQATYAHKLEKNEGEIHWQQSAKMILQKIRAFNPWPVGFSYLQNEKLRIYAATATEDLSVESPGTILSADKQGIAVATGDRVICLTHLQLPGGKVLTAQQLLNSKQDLFAKGMVLGNGHE